MRANEYGCGAGVPCGAAESGAGRGFIRGLEGLSEADGEAAGGDRPSAEQGIKVKKANAAHLLFSEMRRFFSPKMTKQGGLICTPFTQCH